MSISLSQIPGLTSSNVDAVVEGIISAALKGIKIYLTSSALAKLKPYFDELGVKVREVNMTETSGNYILISVEGYRVKIEIHENGKVVTRNFRVSSFIDALKKYIERRKGSKEGVKLYELLISEDLKEKLEKIVHGADEQ